MGVGTKRLPEGDGVEDEGEAVTGALDGAAVGAGAGPLDGVADGKTVGKFSTGATDDGILVLGAGDTMEITLGLVVTNGDREGNFVGP